MQKPQKVYGLLEGSVSLQTCLQKCHLILTQTHIICFFSFPRFHGIRSDRWCQLSDTFPPQLLLQDILLLKTNDNVLRNNLARQGATHIFTYTYTHNTHLHIHLHNAHTHMYIQIYSYICTYTCMHTRVHLYIYIHICTHIHVYTQAPVHVPINIHIRIQFKPELQSYNSELHNHSEPVFPPL